ncbi:hypothetical protein BDW74DRAFT_110443 [Aspergillus multicolor]|uniref:Zn(II)2Cys6 transcription factor domain-containing protein n=1 Tax=Aspergillus multicolor TaxID=41759 RepID=UPI003CCDEA57
MESVDGRGPYGLACQNCAKGKVKCVALANGPGCQRCHRLKKPCRPAHGVRKRGSQTFQAPLIEGMDAKLDSVLTLLQAVCSQSSSPSRASSVPQQCKETPSPILRPPSQPPTINLLPEQPPIMPGLSLTSPEPRDAQEVFNQFITMLNFCPFIYMPADLSVPQLQEERPFLFESMLAVTTRSVQEKLAWAKRIKSRVAQAMVVEGQSNIDLLLALLTYTAWSQDHHLNRMSTLSRLMEMAVSIVNDLNLNKPQPPDAYRLTELGGGYDPNLRRKIPKTRTPEEKRAVMGCFLLSSYVSSYFFQMEPMHWTSQMEDDLRTIEAVPEWVGDSVLATSIRLQLLSQNATRLREEHNSQLHMPFFLRTFRSHLETVRNSIPPDLLEENLVLAQLHSVELGIHETAFTANFDRESPDNDQPVGPEAIDCMWHTLLAIKSWLSVYYRMTAEDHPRFTIITWSQLSRVLVTLYRLTCHPAPDWNCDAVSKTINLVDVFDHIHGCFDQLSPTPSGPFPDDFWARAWLLGRAIEAWVHTPGRLEGNMNARAASVDSQTPGWNQPGGIADGDEALPTWQPPDPTVHLPQPVMQNHVQYANPVTHVWMEELGIPSEGIPPANLSGGGMHY